MADCRCAACGCCKHDHRGWRHAWEPKGTLMEIQDCRSEEGITVGLVDAVISVLRVLAPRDMSPGPVQEALADLLEDPDLQTVRLARRIDGTQESKES